MKIYRGSQKGNDWSITDEKKPNDYIEKWEPGREILFDATKDKSGTKHSLVGVSLNEEDVHCLFNSLLEKYKQRINDLKLKVEALENELENKSNEIGALREAFRKLDWLTSIHSDKAPNSEALVETIQTIAEHYTYHSLEGENPPTIDWIDWKSI